MHHYSCNHNLWYGYGQQKGSDLHSEGHFELIQLSKGLVMNT